MMILRGSLREYRGFTLVELLIVIGIIGFLTAGATLLVTNIINRGRFDTTIESMDTLKFAIIGNPALITNNVRTDFGYNGDMGRLPGSTVPVLDELVNQGAQPAWNPVTQCGWNGPYIRSGFQENPDQFRRDGWENLFTYNNTTGVITSLGSDGAIGGTGWTADINSEPLNINNILTNSVTVKVFDGKGNPGTTAVITVYSPVSGIETPTSYVLFAADAGIHTFTNIPTGMRKIIVTFLGESYTKWVAVVPTTTVSVDFKVVQSPTTPNAPTALTAVPFSTTQINLSWTAPTNNTDGTTLVDLTSYNIYRGITTGTETFLINTGNTNVKFTDTGLAEALTYYYKVSALNSGSRESSQSAEANVKTSQIRQRAGSPPVPLLGNPSQFWRIPIQNYGTNTIIISSMQISWSYSGVERQLEYVQIGPNAAWTTVWGPGSVSTPTGVLNFSPIYSLATGVANVEVRLSFAGGPISLESLTFRFNTSDGYVIVVDAP